MRFAQTNSLAKLLDELVLEELHTNTNRLVHVLGKFDCLWPRVRLVPCSRGGRLVVRWCARSPRRRVMVRRAPPTPRGHGGRPHRGDSGRRGRRRRRYLRRGSCSLGVAWLGDPRRRPLLYVVFRHLRGARRPPSPTGPVTTPPATSDVVRQPVGASAWCHVRYARQRARAPLSQPRAGGRPQQRPERQVNGSKLTWERWGERGKRLWTAAAAAGRRAVRDKQARAAAAPS